MRREQTPENMRPALDALAAVTRIKDRRGVANGLCYAEDFMLAALGLTVDEARETLRGYRLPKDVAKRIKALGGQDSR